LTEALLSQLRELEASTLFNDPGAAQVIVLNGKLAEVEKRLAVATAKWRADPESEHWQAQVDQGDREKRALVKELKQAEAEAANPRTAVWTEAVEMMKGEEQGRLRSALLETIDSVHCVFVPRGKTRLCYAQVWFTGGQPAFPANVCRSYFIIYRGGNGGAVGKRPARWYANSLTNASGFPTMQWDLRRRYTELTEHGEHIDGADAALEQLEDYPAEWIEKLLAKYGRDLE
jgi:hypothetical protein